MRILIATEQAVDLRQVLQQQRVDDCHTMGTLWVIESTERIEELYALVQPQLEPGNRVLIAELTGHWNTYGEMDDCFELQPAAIARS